MNYSARRSIKQKKWNSSEKFKNTHPPHPPLPPKKNTQQSPWHLHTHLTTIATSWASQLEINSRRILSTKPQQPRTDGKHWLWKWRRTTTRRLAWQEPLQVMNIHELLLSIPSMEAPIAASLTFLCLARRSNEISIDDFALDFREVL